MNCRPSSIESLKLYAMKRICIKKLYIELISKLMRDVYFL
jgi:hypothetical protein